MATSHTVFHGEIQCDVVIQSPGVASEIILQCQSEPQSQGSVPVTVVAHTSSDRGAPPSYDEATDPHEPPPSYNSLFGRVREAHRTSKGIIDFLKNVICLLLGTIGCCIELGVKIGIPICMIAMGSIYLHDCPQGEYIPIYLILGGILDILSQLLEFFSAKVRQREEEQEEEQIRQSPTQRVISCFMLGWFIISSVWVYKEYEPNYDPSLGKYCNRTLYLFAFWLTTSIYTVLGVATLCFCCIRGASVAVNINV
jgi:hypothetical protein